MNPRPLGYELMGRRLGSTSRMHACPEYTPMGICCTVQTNAMNRRRDIMLKLIERQHSYHTPEGSQPASAPRGADGPTWPSGNREGSNPSRSPILVTESEQVLGIPSTISLPRTKTARRLIGGRVVAALRRGFLTAWELAHPIREYVSTGPESYFEAGLMKREQHRGL